ncbi:MAG: ankyrin repeat domain-containing protein [Waddliaceae bacterium]
MSIEPGSNDINQVLREFLLEIGQEGEYKTSELDSDFLNQKREVAERSGVVALRLFNKLSRYVEQNQRNNGSEENGIKDSLSGRLTAAPPGETGKITSRSQSSIFDSTYWHPSRFKNRFSRFALYASYVTLAIPLIVAIFTPLVNGVKSLFGRVSVSYGNWVQSRAISRTYDRVIRGRNSQHQLSKDELIYLTEMIQNPEKYLNEGSNRNLEQVLRWCVLDCENVEQRDQLLPQLVKKVDDRTVAKYLIDAIKRQKSGAALALIKAGADVNMTISRDSGLTPLHVASQFGNVEVVQALIEAGADVHRKELSYSRGEFRRTPLHYASINGHVEVVQALIEAKAGMNVRDKSNGNNTPLHYAAHFCHVEVVRAFINAKAGVNIRNRDRKTPLDYATNNYPLDVEQLGKNFYFFVDNNKRNEVISLLRGTYTASSEGSRVRILSPAKIEQNIKELYDLINDGDADEDKILGLIKSGVNVNDARGYYKIPLMAACMKGKINIVRALIEAKADINAEDLSGNTALHYAGSKEVVDVLIEAGANLEARNDRNETPLHVVMLLIEEFFNADTVLALINAGANVNAHSNMRHTLTPLHMALSKKPFNLDIVRALIKAGANVNVNVDGTPLLLSCVPNKEAAEVLIKAGADVDVKAKGYMGQTPLHNARDRGVVEALVKVGADVDAKDDRGETPLHTARDLGAVEVLVKAGADVDAKDDRGRTPFDVLSHKNGMGNLFQVIAKALKIRISTYTLDNMSNKFHRIPQEFLTELKLVSGETEIAVPLLFMKSFSKFFNVLDIGEDKKIELDISKQFLEQLPTLIQALKGEVDLGLQNNKELIKAIDYFDMPIFDQLLNRNIHIVKEVIPGFEAVNRGLFTHLEEERLNSGEEVTLLKTGELDHESKEVVGIDEVQEEIAGVPIHKIVLSLFCNDKKIQEALKNGEPIDLAKRYQKQDLLDALVHLLYSGELPKSKELTKDLLGLAEQIKLDPPIIQYLKVVLADPEIFREAQDEEIEM